ncbi:MAG: RDD family protein [Ignavibacteria bacterium]|nr:RDD family protein [Ignavibacteria bacterium]
MICEKCQNDYPSSYYFATPTICKVCFDSLTEEEKERLASSRNSFVSGNAIILRVGFGKRLLAGLVDSLLLFVFIFLFYNSTGFLDAYTQFFQELLEASSDQVEQMHIQQEFFETNRLNFLFPSLISIIYFLSEAFFGVSLGKALLGIKIARADATSASPAELWIRYLIKNSANLLGILWAISLSLVLSFFQTILSFAILISFLLILGQNRQNLQDMIAKTAVFHKEDIANSK